MRWWLGMNLIACDPPAEETAPVPEPELPRCGGGSGARVGECAGPFSLPTSDGGTFTLDDHLGQIVVVHVASTDSAIDSDASRFLSGLLAERGDFVALDVLARDPVSPPLERSDASSWKDTLGLGQIVAFDGSEQFARDWADTSLFPTLLVLDPTAQILARIHEQYETQLPAALQAALPGE